MYLEGGPYQAALLEAHHAPGALALPSCSEEIDADTGLPMFRGPRIRMGVHLAHPGTFSRRRHRATRTVVYDGAAFQLVQAVCDVAAGGQVLVGGVLSPPGIIIPFSLSVTPLSGYI